MSSAGGKWGQVIGLAALVLVAGAGVAMTSGARVSAAAFQDAQTEAATGKSVLAGVYTEDQAKRGEAVSNKLCASCHGPDLTGGEAGPSLVGLEFLGNWTNLSLADFFDRVHATMPADSPGTMTAQQTSDVTSYVLKLNKFPAGATELPSDLGLLKDIKIEGPR